MSDIGKDPKMGENAAVEGKEESTSMEQSGLESGTPASNQSSSAPNLKRALTTPLLSTPTSATSSPKPSREGSPIRLQHRPGGSSGTRSATRSRKNSQDLSPVRGPSAPASSIPTVPSAAAIQRALSAAGTPSLPPSSQQDASADIPRPQRATKHPPANSSQSAPRTPRLSSPPPAASSGSSKSVLTAARKIEHSQTTPATPSIVLERPTRKSTSAADSDAGEEETVPRSGMRTPIRGASGSGAPLETVQESSLPATPAAGTGVPSDKSKNNGHDRPEPIEENPMEEALAKEGKPINESGNESSGSKNIRPRSGDDGKELRKTPTVANTVKPPTIQSKKSYTQLPTKGKVASEGSIKNMTVETETVSSIPHVAVGGGTSERNMSGRTDTGGSLRLKPSTETIRPKKEKKKVMRKAPSLNAGTGGCFSRRLHHHHVHARPPSPDLCDTSSIGSPESFDDQVIADEALISPLYCSKSRDSRSSVPSPVTTAFNSNPHGPPRRFSSGLISFRGRIASSKADIFEAKVASAVDEADSSDSEETFVYESNPPEPLSARPHRFHSRTPSTASTLSQIDHHGAKGRQDGHHSIVGKKSMKFANNYNSINFSNESEGTVRGPSQAVRGAGTPHHHHIGRFGRGGHSSIFDNESPFPNAVKTPRSASSHLQQISPRHNSQRSPNTWRLSGNPRKAEEILSYDLEGEGADDERAPLMGSVRSGRTRRRALPGSVRQMYANEDRDYRFCGRITAFTSLGSILALLIAAIVVILVLCTKPLYDVRVKDIRNVLASESELMLDLHVHAINPNIIAIQISDLDVNLFAKSRHVGTSSLWRQQTPDFPPQIPSRPAETSQISNFRRRPNPLRTPSDLIDQLDGGVDEGTDPIDDDDPATDSQTMLLGRIYSFDSPLIFDPSPLHHRSLSSVGEVRLSRPGNRTEEGGTARWERVLLHDFELIVRGVVKYSLPISTKVRSASIGGKVMVHPSQDDGTGGGGMRLSRPKEGPGRDGGSNVIISPPLDGHIGR